MDIYLNGVNDGGTYSGSGGSIGYTDSNVYIGQDGAFEDYFMKAVQATDRRFGPK